MTTDWVASFRGLAEMHATIAAMTRRVYVVAERTPNPL